MNCLIGLGSNVGDRQSFLEESLKGILANPRVSLIAKSSFYETVPIGMSAKDTPFLNGVAALASELPSIELFSLLQKTEHELGRTRTGRWDARNIDLDLLLFGEEELHTEELVVPHPRMTFRGFVLQGAMEVAADWVHPTTGWTVAQLWHNLSRKPRYVALCGDPNLASLMVRDLLNHSIDCKVCLDPCAAASSSGHPNQAAIEFLDLRLAELTRCCQDQLDDRVCVSSFWIGQGPGEVPADHPWLQPTLLVNVPAGTDNQVMDDCIDRWFNGPVLSVNGSDPEWASRELRAVVESLQTTIKG